MFLLIAFSILSAPGCKSQNEKGASGMTKTNSLSNPSIIDSVPFGELNGKKEYNASGVIQLSDSRFLFCDNNTGDKLFELQLTPDGRQKDRLIPRPLQGIAPDQIDDLEDLTLVQEDGRRYVFIVSSLYVKKAKQDRIEIPPSGVIRAMINQDDSLTAENMPGFRDWLITAYPQLSDWAQTIPDKGGINIEGIAWDQNRHALLIGLRTPVLNGKPLILPVKVKNLAGSWNTGNLEALPAIQLSVESTNDEQGIRGISYDQNRGAFLVITGKSVSDSKADFALYEWKGEADGKTRRLDYSFAKKMKPEGITHGTIGGKSVLVIVDDAGGFMIVWDNPAQLNQ
jgi:hypothetical protein